jgi:hypothetical protein
MIRTFILHAIHSGGEILVVISLGGMIITGGTGTTIITAITTMITTVMQEIAASHMIVRMMTETEMTGATIHMTGTAGTTVRHITSVNH